MTKNKRLSFWVIFAVVTLLVGSFVSGLGVTPGRTTIDFVPGLEQEVTFNVVNSESKDASIVLTTQGELRSHVTLNEKELFITSGEKNIPVSYTVRLPDSMEPGTHSAEIVVLELPDTSGTSEAFVGAALAVVTQLIVKVPYPGKYAEAKLNVINAESDSDIQFIIPIANLGKSDIFDARANVDVYNKLNEKVGSFDTKSVRVNSGARSEIVHVWKSDGLPAGQYRAVATLIYDSQTLTLEEYFNIGSADLKLESVEVAEGFELGDIAKFDMLVENKWSEPISGAYAQTHVFGPDGKILEDFKSQNYDINPLQKEVMTSYWDTAGVKEGKYKVAIYLKYGEKSFREDLEFKVSQSKIEIIGFGYVISEKEFASGDNSKLVMILIGVIVFLVIVNLSWFIILRKKFFKK
jgi:hypothetical protein